MDKLADTRKTHPVSLPARPGPGRLAAEKEAAGCDDLLTGRQALEDLDQLASRRPHFYGALGESAFLAFDRGVHHHPLTHGLHGGLRHHGRWEDRGSMAIVTNMPRRRVSLVFGTSTLIFAVRVAGSTRGAM